jgi:4-hydroxy-4-methyl-2-oxoglutarate aldolase
MIEDPSRLVIRAKFARLGEAQLAPFRERTTSFVVDAMNGRGALDHAISRSTRAAGSSAPP